MTPDISWLSEGLPIFAFALITFLVYAVLAKTKVLGEGKAVQIIISLILATIFITFTSVRKYLLNITPLFALLLVVSFFFLMLIFFIVKDPEKLTKPLGIVFIILMAIMLIAVMFYTFPSTRALLPGAYGYEYDKNYDRDCDYDYDYDYFDKEDCDEKDSFWKCYKSDYWRDYEIYDKCIKKDGRYKCYDYDDEICYDKYDKDDCYDRDDCYDEDYDYRYRDYEYDSENVFIRARNWFYRDKIITAFWLLVVAAIAIFVVTRK